MEWCGDKTLRAILGTLCAVACVGVCLPAAATLLPHLAGSSQDAQDAADLADASADSSVQRALSAMPVKTAAEKATATEAHTDAAQKPANPASAAKSDPRPLGETLHAVAKDLAVSTGAVEAKQYLGTEFGSDKATDVATDTETNALRRRASNGDAADTGNAPPRSADQAKIDEEQASFLASALVREVTPWAIGAAVLLFCAQGLRAMLAFSRRKAERKRKFRKSSGTRNARL